MAKPIRDDGATVAMGPPYGLGPGARPGDRRGPFHAGPMVLRDVLRAMGADPHAVKHAGLLNGRPRWYTILGDNFGTGTDEITVPIRKGADFLWTHTVGSIGATAAYSGGNLSDLDLLPRMESGGEYLSDDSIRADLIAGTQEDPGWMPVPVRVARQDDLTFRVTNNGGAPRYFVLHLCGWDLSEEVDLVYPRRPFYHRFDFTTTGASNQQTANTQTASTGFFAWTRALGFSDTTDWWWRPQDEDADRRFVGGRSQGNAGWNLLHSALTVGDATRPADFAWPLVLRPSSDLGITVEELATGAGQGITMVAAGIYLDDMRGKTPAEVRAELLRSGIGV